MLGLLRFFGLRALERRLFGNGRAAGGWGRVARAGMPLGGWPMLAYLAWSNRSRLASAFRWARGQFGSRGAHSLPAGVRVLTPTAEMMRTEGSPPAARRPGAVGAAGGPAGEARWRSDLAS